MSLKPFSAVILATVLAGIWMVSPVAGLRPWRAGRLIFANLAKPERDDFDGPLDRLANDLGLKAGVECYCLNEFTLLHVAHNKCWLRPFRGFP